MTEDRIIEDKAEAKGIELDANGDPVRQGTLMIERESYERVIEGLKMISDACAHLMRHEPENTEQWRAYKVRFDKARRICVQHAGIGLSMKENETAEVRGEPIPWRKCRERFLEGVQQAAGGCRQLAVCFRNDVWWASMRQKLGQMAEKLNAARRASTRQALRNSGLILPPGYH